MGSDTLDLFLRSNAGGAPLPEADDLENQLLETGFTSVRKTRLMPTNLLYGFVAR